MQRFLKLVLLWFVFQEPVLPQVAFNTGSGGGTSYGPFASLPATCTQGALYIPSDKAWNYVCSATDIWQATLYGVQITPPFAANFTALQNSMPTGTWADTYAGMYLTKAYQNGHFVLGSNAAVPSTPWTFECGFIQNTASVADTPSGPAIWQNLNSRYEVMFLFNGVGVSTSINFDSWAANVYNSTYGPSKPAKRVGGPATWMRISNDGVNITSAYSTDGINYVPFNSHAATVWLAAVDNFAFVMRSESGSMNGFLDGVTIFHWRVF